MRRIWSAAAAGTAVLALAVSGCAASSSVADPQSPPPQQSSSPPSSSPTSAGSASPTSESPTPEATPTPKATPKAKAKAMMGPGDTSTQVRELQVRLRQLDWYAGRITGTYDKPTREGVEGFQAKRKLEQSGSVDKDTWAALTAMTTTPTEDEKFNRLTPGKALWAIGSQGDKVRELQARLKQIGWFSGKVSGYYGTETAAGVRGFQAKREIPKTGEVDERTWDRLTAMTRTPTTDEKLNKVPRPKAVGLDSRCMTGRAMCISKRTNTLSWVIDGNVQMTMDVRFGSDELPTREGTFSVGWKSRDHVSTLYHTKMPYAMFFSGGQAVHYSPDFAARGYNGASHGCVNVRNLSGIQSLFDQARVGDKVIVHR